uniref:ATPase_AAA_core domain-containing protein n=1 Tax=Steinernema glaseri TaxID=37863 RepID=A0A1I8ART9_9BILA
TESDGVRLLPLEDRRRDGHPRGSPMHHRRHRRSSAGFTHPADAEGYMEALEGDQKKAPAIEEKADSVGEGASRPSDSERGQEATQEGLPSHLNELLRLRVIRQDAGDDAGIAGHEAEESEVSGDDAREVPHERREERRPQDSRREEGVVGGVAEEDRQDREHNRAIVLQLQAAHAGRGDGDETAADGGREGPRPAPWEPKPSDDGRLQPGPVLLQAQRRGELPFPLAEDRLRAPATTSPPHGQFLLSKRAPLLQGPRKYPPDPGPGPSTRLARRRPEGRPRAHHGGARLVVDEASKIFEKATTGGFLDDILNITNVITNTFQRVEHTFSQEQRSQMKEDDYTFLSAEQMRQMFTSGGVFHVSDLPFDLDDYATWTEKERENALVDKIRSLAEEGGGRSSRSKRQITLSPFAFSPTKFELGVLAPMTLSPNIFSPIILAPSVLSPPVFTPMLGSPLVFAPFILGPNVFSAAVFDVYVFSPYFISPNVFNPYVLSPLILSPHMLSPDVVSHTVLSGTVLNPFFMSPPIGTESALAADVLSPSFLSKR